MSQMILSASVMIALGVLIRKIALNRLPKRIFVIIWGLVSVRLLIPFSLPAMFSVLHVSNLPIAGVLPSAGGSDVYPNMLIPAPVAMPAYPVAQIPSASMNWPLVLLSLWVLGSIIFALVFLISHVKFRRKLRTSLPLEQAFVTDWLALNQTVRSVQVRYSDQISSPLTYGIFRPVIVLPASMDLTDEVRLNYVLTHEHVHIRRFDYVWKLLFAAVLCVHWFNPLVWLMYVLTNRDMELSCDEAVLGLLGQKSKATYGLALLDLAEENSRLVFASSFSKHALEERIRVMARAKRKSVLGAVAVLLLITCTMLVFAAPLAEAAHAQFAPKAWDNTPYTPTQITNQTFEIDLLASGHVRVISQPTSPVIHLEVEFLDEPQYDLVVEEIRIEHLVDAPAPIEQPVFVYRDPPPADLARERPPSDVIMDGGEFHGSWLVRMSYADYIAVMLRIYGISSLEELERLFPDDFPLFLDTIEQLRIGRLHFYRIDNFANGIIYTSGWFLERPGIFS